MKQRILVAVVGVPLLLFVLCWAPAWATTILLLLLCGIGASELLTAVCGKEKGTRLCGLTGAMTAFIVLNGFSQVDFPELSTSRIILEIIPWFVCAGIVILFLMAVRYYGTEKELHFQDICAVLMGGIAIPAALTCLLRLRLMPYGGGLVLIPLVAAFCSDSLALFAGMLFGKHKLAPHASPKKTVEGAIGGLVGGMVGMVLFRIIFACCTGQKLDIIWCLALGLIGAALGQLGDLSFSIIKRQYGIKDYGHLLPGHGGVLDRFDSVIFAAPVIWMIISHVALY